MCKPLSELDNVYMLMGNAAPRADRLSYCMKLIESTEEYLSRNQGRLTTNSLIKSRELIKSAQKEIIALAKKKPSGSKIQQNRVSPKQ
jgi:hypothetical protein